MILRDFISSNFALITGIFFMTIFIISDKKLDKITKHLFGFELLFCIIEMLAYSLELQSAQGSVFSYRRILLSAIGYSVRPFLLYFILILSMRTESTKRKKILLSLPAFVNIVLAFSAFVTPLVYSYTITNEFVRGPLGYISHIVVVLYLIMILVFTVYNRNKKNRLEIAIIISIVAVIMISLVAEALIHEINIGRTAIILSIIFYYMYFESITFDKKKQEQYRIMETLSDTYIDVALINLNDHSFEILRIDETIQHSIIRENDFKKIIQEITATGVDETDLEKVREFINLDFLSERLNNTQMISCEYKDKKHGWCRIKLSYVGSPEAKNIDKVLCTIQSIEHEKVKEIEMMRELEETNQKLEEMIHKADEASRAKTDFFSRMSHDMRTPMNGILGIAGLSEEETNIDILHDNISKIEQSGQYLLGLINDTLDLQKIDSGMLKLEPQIVSTRELVNNVLMMIQIECQKKGIQLNMTTSNADLDCLVKVDPMRMKQIFFNLLSNAVKFTPPGGIIDINFKCLGHTGNIAHDIITITDTGIGMSKEFWDNQIFKPFSQEHSDIVTNDAGSGLGLSIVKRLVELMNGEITVESELGEGTKFIVTIDFERAAKQEIEEKEHQSEVQKSQTLQILENKHILLAEDHPLNAEIAKRLLKKVGCIVEWVKDGQECINRFSSSPIDEFDLILMDIRMPNIDGITATKMIRALSRADASTIPIIAMTANAYDSDVKQCLDSGMNAHISKPVNPDVMYEAIIQNLK